MKRVIPQPELRSGTPEGDPWGRRTADGEVTLHGTGTGDAATSEKSAEFRFKSKPDSAVVVDVTRDSGGNRFVEIGVYYV